MFRDLWDEGSDTTWPGWYLKVRLSASNRLRENISLAIKYYYCIECILVNCLVAQDYPRENISEVASVISVLLYRMYFRE